MALCMYPLNLNYAVVYFTLYVSGDAKTNTTVRRVQ